MTVEGLGRLTRLTKLGLWKTRLTDLGLEFLKGLPNLEELILDDETLTRRSHALFDIKFHTTTRPEGLPFKAS